MCMTHSVQQLYPYAIVMCPVRHKRYARTVRRTKGWKENGTDGMADVFKSVVGWLGTKKLATVKISTVFVQLAWF